MIKQNRTWKLRWKILALVTALVIGAVTLTDAQEKKRPAAEIQADIDKLQTELREARLSAMFEEHKFLTSEQRYEEALLIARKAKELAPDDPSVQALLPLSQRALEFQKAQKAQKEPATFTGKAAMWDERVWENLGIWYEPIPAEEYKRMRPQLPRIDNAIPEGGVVVKAVREGSPAAQAKLLPGDIIVGIDPCIVGLQPWAIVSAGDIWYVAVQAWEKWQSETSEFKANVIRDNKVHEAILPLKQAAQKPFVPLASAQPLEPLPVSADPLVILPEAIEGEYVMTGGYIPPDIAKMRICLLHQGNNLFHVLMFEPVQNDESLAFAVFEGNALVISKALARNGNEWESLPADEDAGISIIGKDLRGRFLLEVYDNDSITFLLAKDGALSELTKARMLIAAEESKTAKAAVPRVIRHVEYVPETLPQKGVANQISDVIERFPDADIDVLYQRNGEVRLRGKAVSQSQRNKIVEQVNRIVTKVNNEIQVVAATEEEPAFKVYSLRGLPVSSDRAYNIIYDISKPSGDVRMTLDDASSMLLVFGCEADHATVAEVLSQLRTSEDVKESAVAEDKLTLCIYTPPISIESAFALVGKRLAGSPDVIVGDTDDKRLILWGRKSDHEKVQALFEQIAKEIQQTKEE